MATYTYSIEKDFLLSTVIILSDLQTKITTSAITTGTVNECNQFGDSIIISFNSNISEGDINILTNIVNTYVPTVDEVITSESVTSISNKNLYASSNYIVDDSDPSKRIGFTSTGASSESTLTFNSLATSNITISFPDVSDTVVTLEAPQTLSNKTFNSTSFIGPGNSSPLLASLYVNPSFTNIIERDSPNYYFTYLATPLAGGSTKGDGYTLYIDGAPSGNFGTVYSLYVNAGNSYFGGNMRFSNNAVDGYVLRSDPLGNATWYDPSLLNISFPSGTASLPGMFFTGESGTGFYKAAVGQIGVELSGANYVLFKTTGTDFKTGQTVNIGTAGTTSPLNVRGLITGTNGLTVSGANTSLTTLSTSGLITANAGLTLVTGQTLNVGTTGKSSPANIFGLITGTNGLTISSGNTSLTTLSTSGLITANAGVNITTGFTLNVGTSGTTTPANIFGLITGTNGLTVSGANTSLTTLSTSGLITANAGVNIATGQTLNIGTAGTTSPLNVRGLITGTNGLTVSGANTSLTSLSTSGLITANAGLTLATGQTLNVGTTGTTSPANIFGLITGTNGLTVSGANTSLTTLSTSGLITANSGLTLATGQTINVGTSGTTSPANIFGLITGTNGLTISSGSTSLTSLSTSGLITANAGVNIATGFTLNVGTSGTTSLSNFWGLTTHKAKAIINGAGSNTAAASTFYINPDSTALTGANNYFFTYLNSPTVSGTTTGAGYTMFINGPPTGGTITSPFSLYVNSGTSYFGGTIRYPTNAANGRVLQSDAFGNASWVDQSTLTISQNINYYTTTDSLTTDTTSGTAVDITGMTMTPAAGTYYVIFFGAARVLSSNRVFNVQLAVNGVFVSNSFSSYTIATANIDIPVITSAIITVNGTDTITAQFYRGATTATIRLSSQKNLTAIKLA